MTQIQQSNMQEAQRRLCILMPNFISERVGGVEIQTFLIAKYLAARQWEVHFVAETKVLEKMNTSEKRDGIEVHWLKRRGLFSFFRKDIGLKLKEINPSIIYQRGRSRFTASPVAYTYARKSRIKLVYHCAEDSDTDRNFNLQQVRESAKSFFKKWILSFHAILSDRYFIKTIASSEMIIVQNKIQAARVRGTFGLPSHLIRSSHEIPEPPFIKAYPPIVFWIAHAGRRKRLELFVELARKFHNEETRFVFAGTIPQNEYRQEIFSLMDGLSNIEYLGPLNWDKSNAMFAKASVFVNTTLPDREGFPNTYIQAWLHETPVITLDCDPDSIIKTHKLGFHSKSSEKLVEDLYTLLHDSNLLKTMAKNARAYAVAHHDIAKTSDTLNSLMSQLITEKL